MRSFQKTAVLILAILHFLPISAEDICSYPAEAEITVTSKTGIKTSFAVGIAETSDEHEKGLMHCQELKKGTGLFFVFNDDRQHYFWMKNTKIELAIIYIDKNFNVVSVKKGQPMSEKMIPSIYQSRYVLELNWAEGGKILPGDTVSFKMK